MRRICVHIAAFVLFAGLIAGPIPCLGADNDAPAKATLHITSIRAKHVQGGETKYEGISDSKLKKQLKSLDDNSFEAVKSGSKTIAEGDSDNYDTAPGVDSTCKIMVTKIEKWTNAQGVTETYVEVKITVTKDGKEIGTVEGKRKAGEYLVLVFKDFFPAENGGDMDDLVLAIQPTE